MIYNNYGDNMKIAVFSDIHGNYQALKAILKKIGNEYYDIIFLGDAIGLGPDSYDCVKLLQEKNVKFVLGNHDLYYTRGSEIDEDLKGLGLKHHNWVVKNLNGIKLEDRSNDKDLRYDLKIKDHTFSFFHFFLTHQTYPFEHLDILKDDRYIEVFDREDAEYTFYGHNHEEDYHKINGKHYYGIGSSGCTKDNKTYFYSIFIDKKVTIKRVKVTYDRKTFENRMKDIKYPDKTNIEKIFFGL